jgi:hypothetical protein
VTRTQLAGLQVHSGAGDSWGKAQLGGQVVNVSATDARTDHSIPSNKRRGRKQGHRKGVCKAAIRPVQDLSVSVKRSLFNVGHWHVNASKNGARKTINSRSGELCSCGQRDASPITAKVKKTKDKKKWQIKFSSSCALDAMAE